jgi:hypothetical protein
MDSLMKKLLSEEQFIKATRDLNLGEQTLRIARGVLVDGIPQKDFVSKFNLSKGAISQAVSRVWTSHEKISIPNGYKLISVLLPEQKVFIVKKWEQEAIDKLKRQGNIIDGNTSNS